MSLVALSVLAMLFLLFITAHTGLVPLNPTDYEQRAVAFSDCEGNNKSELDVRVADSQSKKYVGLSNTESLDSDSGMLFEYRSNSNKTIVMRNMNFPIDVIFVDSDGKINSIKSVEQPQGTLEYYITYKSVSALGKYVIETNKGWADSNNIREGDCIRNL